jgi:hypothetical protein
MNGVRRVNWTLVYDVLRGERQTLGKADELTELVYSCCNRWTGTLSWLMLSILLRLTPC